MQSSESEQRPGLYDRLRPALFWLSPDRSHALAQTVLRLAPLWRVIPSARPAGESRLATTFAGVPIANPIGLAAGLDKDADALCALARLGFGFLTIGSIMPAVRPGNPYPRLVRYRATESLADAMGVPSKGLDHAAARLAAFAPRRTIPVFANIGGFDADAIATSYARLAPFIDGAEISLMCPNVPQAAEAFDAQAVLCDVLARIAARPAPLVVRVPNDVAADEGRLAPFIEACVAGGIRGLKIGGGRPVAEPALGTGRGTLHGRAIFDQALANVVSAVRLARGRLDIKGNGGIFSATDARKMLDAGCACVDLYSALIFRGPGVARQICRGLADQPAGVGR